ncbi:MAG: response regulator [Campylobacterota bacterium]|nr:response regulator [Campylobacterota bacterium]
MKIAIIDDEKEILEMLKRYLNKQAHEVITYQNPLTALSTLDKSTDLVLLDIMMPQINGLELLPKLQEKFPNLKIVMMTAYSTLDTVLDSHRGGAVQYIIKPFESLSQLEVQLNKVFEK